MICFLSYARKDKNPYLTSFLSDLRDAVTTFGGIDNPLFVDEEGIGNGADWPATLGDALTRCRVFAYLHSPMYFTRQDCGREWRAFRQRMEAAKAVTRDAYKLSPMIPIHWIPTTHTVSDLPGEVASVQFTLPGMDPRYQQSGMLNLAKIRNDPAYGACVDMLAKHILRCAKEVGLPPAERLQPYASIVPAFPSPSVQSPVAEAAGAARPTLNDAGPRRAKFLFVAASPSELKNVRQNVAAYEPSGEEMWKPFFTKAPEEEAALIAQDACVNTKLIFEAATVVKDIRQFRKQLEAARQGRTPVIIFIDVWTLRLEPYQNALRDLDEMPPSNCMPFMPWDLDDKETRDARATLCQVMEDTFPWLLTNGKYKSNFESITSVEELRLRVETALTEIKNIIIRRLRPTTGILGPQIAMPILPSPTTAQ